MKLRLLLITTLATLAGFASAQTSALPAPEPLPTLALDGEVYAPAFALSQRLGIELSWREAGRGAQLRAGQRWIEVRTDSVLARSEQGRQILRTAPFEYQGMMYLPVEPIVPLLGGEARRNAGELQLALGGRELSVPLAPATQTPVLELPAAQIFGDPRVPLARLQAGHSTLDTLRTALNRFNSIVQPLLPALTALNQSRSLALLKHLPVVGGLLTNITNTLTVTGEALALANQLAAIDDQQGVPVRQAIAAAIALGTNPSRDQAARQAAVWQAALPALDERVKLLDRGKLGMIGLRLATAGLDQRVGALTQQVVGSRVSLPPAVAASGAIADEVTALLQGSRYETALLRTYFQRLIEWSGAAPGAAGR